jgi:hypothetical protein
LLLNQCIFGVTVVGFVVGIDLDWIGERMMSGRREGGNGKKWWNEEQVKRGGFACVPCLGYRRCGIVLVYR